MAKMSKKWVVLCSAALGAIYAAEYLTTDTQAALPPVSGLSQSGVQTNNRSAAGPQASDSAIGILAPSGTAVPSNVQSGSTGAANASSAAPSTPASPSRSANKIYKNGTYKGVGSNRRGYIEVTVTTKNDKITDVEVSDFAMHYSESDIVGLPDEVLRKQSSQVDNVSGATYSTRAFEDAVQEALAQAKVG